MFTGMWTMISRVGLLSTLVMPSERFRRRAASSKRACCASQGFVSCSTELCVCVMATISVNYSKAYVRDFSYTTQMSKTYFCLTIVFFAVSTVAQDNEKIERGKY